MDMGKLSERLAGGIVIFDGAMGTEIYRRNFFVNASYEQLCLSSPDTIRGIHQSYLDAGAEVLTTNSFNANARRLGRFGLAADTVRINRAAAQLAREVAGDRALVAGSIAKRPITCCGCCRKLTLRSSSSVTIISSLPG